jgi:hypothetical protein
VVVVEEVVFNAAIDAFKVARLKRPVPHQHDSATQHTQAQPRKIPIHLVGNPTQRKQPTL